MAPGQGSGEAPGQGPEDTGQRPGGPGRTGSPGVGPAVPVDTGRDVGLDALRADLQDLQHAHGHGHPEALEAEERLARAAAAAGLAEEARAAYEEVLLYRSVLDGEHAERTAVVARDLFALVSGLDDRPAMAEVYYRFLSWIPMRDPASLTPTLREVLADVEGLLARQD